jgi:tetratricopeptide (TPR) repeat protein
MRSFWLLQRSFGWVSLASLFVVSIAHGQVDSGKLPEANGEESSEASKAFWSGKEFYESGQFSRAQEQFQRAYLLTKDPDLLYDIGQTYRKVGQCALALRSYQDFLRQAPESPLGPQAAKQVSELQTSCPQAHQETTVEVQSDQRHSESPARFALVSEHSPAKPQLSPGLVRDQAGFAKQLRAWTYVTLAAGIAAGGTAAVLEIWNDRRYGDWSDRNRNLAQGVASIETPSEWLTRQQSNDQLGISIQRVDREVLFISLGAGALLTTSAVLFLATSKQSTKTSATTKPHPDVLVQPIIIGGKLLSLSMRGTF